MKSNKLVRLTIFGVEQTFKNKLWIILNILMILATLVAVNFSTVKEIIETRKNDSGAVDEDILTLMVNDETNMFKELLKKQNNEKIVVAEYSENGIDEGNVLVDIKLDEKQYIKVTITSAEYIDIEYYSIIEEVLNEIRNNIFAKVHNIQIEEAEKLNTAVEIERVITTLDATTYEKYSGIFFGATFVIYMLFIFIASTLASTIGMEKISRTTEYMLTGISENAYLWYNILQTNIVVILQSALGIIYFLVANLIKSLLMQSYLGLEITMNAASTMGAIAIDPIVIQAIIVAFVQAIFSILILSIIQAVLSSRVNNMSDVSNSTVLVLFFVIFATMVFPNIIPTQENVNIFLKIVSLIPVVSTIAVPKLLLLGQAGTIYSIISVIISIIALVFLTIFGAKAFKKGLLSINNSGKKTERVENAKKEDLNDSKFKSSISKVAMALILFLVCSNILAVISEILLVNVQSTIIRYLVSIITWIISIYPSYWYLTKSNYEKKSKEKNEKKSFKNMVFATSTAFGVVWIIQISQTLLPMKEVDITAMAGLDFSTPLNCLLAIVYIAVLPAIFEELLFRKAMFGSLKKYGTTLAMVCSSVAFGIMHQNLTQGVFAFLMGLVLCILVNKTGSIVPAMVIHFANNFIGVLQMMLINNSDLSDLSTIPMKSLIIIGIIGIIILGFMAFSVVALVTLKLKNVKFVENEDNILKVKNPLKIICTDFITLMTIFVYGVITICITKML